MVDRLKQSQTTLTNAQFFSVSAVIDQYNLTDAEENHALKVIDAEWRDAVGSSFKAYTVAHRVCAAICYRR